jgi:predicted metal-dependent phosphoesterase TrpH
MILKGDFHMHTRYSYDCLVEPDALVDRCLKVGLNCIAVTDHNSLAGALAVKGLAPFFVILGEEIKTTHGEITGLFLTEEIPKGLSPLETVQRIKAQGGLVSLPHPFDRVGRSPLESEIMDELVSQVDIIEGFNARTTFRGDNMRSQKFAEEHSLPMTAVSDAHTLGELGISYTELPEFDGSASGFKDALKFAKLTERTSSPLVHVYSTLNKLRRRLFHPL